MVTEKFFSLHMLDGKMFGFGHKDFNKYSKSSIVLYVKLFDVANFMMAQLAAHNEISLSEYIFSKYSGCK